MGSTVEREATRLLSDLNATGEYPLALVCTAEGLLVASAGERARTEMMAILTSLFDDIATRAVRDLGLRTVAELSLSSPGFGSFVVRPLDPEVDPRLFLVVQVPSGRTWRRNTGAAARELLLLLRPLLGPKAKPP